MNPRAAAHSFHGSTLLISLRSPFARRVRLAFLENQVQFQENVVDVLKPNPELLELNPLGRVPTLVLPSGRVIVESSVILQLFYEGQESALMPKGGIDRMECLQWSSLATGLCEKIVEYYFEMLRPEEKRDLELIAEIQGTVQRALARFEAQLVLRDHLVSTGLTQADLDLGTVLAYLTLRYSDSWRQTHPQCAEFLDRMNQRASFQVTLPPKA